MFRTCLNAGDWLWIISGHDHGDMQLPVMEMVVTFQHVDRPPPVPSRVDMLAIAMGRLLPAMDMKLRLELKLSDKPRK